MKQLYDDVSHACSKLTTRAYSTSFSLGIHCLGSELHAPIYAIYGFVRFADEIVDTFHEYDKEELLTEFINDTWKAIDRKISLNPILNSFQHVVHTYNIDRELITCFLDSMTADLHQAIHSEDSYKDYIVGSAEVVGLMCLRVFTNNDRQLYDLLEQPARKLGAAFQKVNFLRDLKNDYEYLGRVYFPGVDFRAFSDKEKQQIEQDIDTDFREAYLGIRQLPKAAKFGVYMAYVYYRNLFGKIREIPSARILIERVRISNRRKIGLLVTSYFKHSFSLI